MADSRPRLYLDIDGVLLAKRQQLPAGVEKFLAFVLLHFDCYWLTTHCQGEAATALRYLAGFYPAGLLAKLAAVQPTTWQTLKTEGIDLATDFYWLDDYPFEAEKRILVQAGRLNRLIECDLRRDGELLEIVGQLQRHLWPAP